MFEYSPCIQPGIRLQTLVAVFFLGVRLHPVKPRLWHKQMLRFCIIGSCSLLVYLSTGFLLLNMVGLTLMAANIIAFFPATVVSYLGQALWSFEASTEISALLKFVVLSVLALAATMLISYSVTESSIPDSFGILINAVVLPIISFAVQKLWVFQK